MPSFSSVDQYISKAPQEFQEDLKLLRRLIRTNLPAAVESMGSNGFPVYTDGDKWLAGFAWRKKGAMLYIMNSGLLDRYESQLGKLRSGKSCIEWRPGNGLTLERLQQLCDELLSQVCESR